MKGLPQLRHALLAGLLGALTVGTLASAHRDVGYVRDEGIYFEASRRYAAWLSLLVTDPSQANRRKVRDRYLAVNHEHPALMKMVGGATARVLAEPPAAGTEVGNADRGGPIPVMPEGAAMRLPAQLLCGLGVALLYVAGVGLGGTTAAGLLAAGWFLLTPRVFFHAGLHAFDVPVAVATLWVVLAYRRALRSPRWGLALGPLLGVAIAIKHNALFIPVLLAIHWMCTIGWAKIRDQRPVARGQWIPLPLWSMAILAPLTALALWPWLWSAPVDRIADYFEFHRQHNWYNMEFLGHNYNQPPMPVAYPAVLTWATVPSVLLVLAAVGVVVAVRGDLLRPPPRALGPAPQCNEGSLRRPLGEGWAPLDGLLLALFSAFPLVLIALPSTPIFGGTKHWLTAYPFMGLCAAVAWKWIWARASVGRRRQRWLQPAVLALVLGPGVLGITRGHPYGLSQYAPLVGGPRGAARMGLGRGFWGHAVLPLLPGLKGTRAYLHDLHELCRKQYAREGRWPAGTESVGLSRADTGLIFHELHTLSDELALQERLSTGRPHAAVLLHDVPLTSQYARPR